MTSKKEKFTAGGFITGMLIPTILTCGALKYNDFTTNLKIRSQAYAEAVDVSPKEVIRYNQPKYNDFTTNPEKRTAFVAEAKDVSPKEVIRYNQKQTSQLENIVDASQEVSRIEKVAEVIYGEAANQPWNSRYLVGRVIMNRLEKEGYPKTLDKVLSQYNGFSCANADVSGTWKQAISANDPKTKYPMNQYDKKVWKECKDIAKYVLSGKLRGISNERNVIAYHDARVWYSNLTKDKKNKQYWLNLVHVARQGNLEFYKSIKDEKIPTKAPYFNGLDSNHCAEYVRLAGEFYGWKFAPAPTPAWKFSDKNIFKAKVKGSLKGYENYLVPKKSAVTFYYEHSDFHDLAMKETGNNITHVALYMGKNQNGEMCFAENAGKVQRLISYSGLINRGYSPREIVEPRGVR